MNDHLNYEMTYNLLFCALKIKYDIFIRFN